MSIEAAQCLLLRALRFLRFLRTRELYVYNKDWHAR